MTQTVELRALEGIPEVQEGADLAALLRSALQRSAIELRADDVLVIAQKIVSKAEGRRVRLTEIEPSAEALQWAGRVGKDPRFVELVLRESSEVVRAAPNILITRHRSGHVMANAGIDRSNLPGNERDESVLLLPRDADAAAAALRLALAPISPAVIISDSFGRPWRQGTVNVALGCAGLSALIDLRGGVDREGRTLQTTQIALADAVAAAAGLVMGETQEGTPAVLVRGMKLARPEYERGIAPLLRSREEDLFR